jgi:F-type H+-transporting ATPase subunit alpha
VEVEFENYAPLARARAAHRPQLRSHEAGIVRTVSAGVATVSGLPGLGLDECVRFAGSLSGIALNLDEGICGVALLGESADLETGTEALRTNRVMDVPVGEGLLGRVIDPLGRPLDGAGPVNFAARLPIERPRRTSWTVLPSACLSRPACRSSMRSCPSGAASAN